MGVKLIIMNAHKSEPSKLFKFVERLIELWTLITVLVDSMINVELK